MKYLSICFSLILITMFSVNAYSQVKINHIAVYVENINASGQFYENVVGLQEIDEPFNDGLHLWYDIGGGAALHLIEREEPWPNPAIDKTNHLCFSVPDMNAFINCLENAGISYQDWPGNEGEITTRTDGILQIYLQDPSGYWLEINNDH